ncbi:LuxR family transcriptional regulator [Streptomyces corchorusii]|uniref:LuxR family transcriptional regulator n=2 Tax=Streptomyces TaxID=1883 RepID=A0A101PTY4_STRCK|nr:LuxR C-terminal-related transcriptional regulator [Streptomyces corchorusii]KUN17611.1 LuxR family transcriptional regulator [Streptomyces corchorusii]
MSTPRIKVAVHAEDPISRVGVVAQLRVQPELRLLDNDGLDGNDGRDGENPDVVVLVADEIDQNVIQQMRRIQRSIQSRILLVPKRIDTQQLIEAAECGVTGVVRRVDATADELTRAITRVARGGGDLPEDLVAQLMGTVSRLQSKVLGHQGLLATGMSRRELDILKLVAEGFDTAGIAAKLSYSERLIKLELSEIYTRFHLRNRSHAVAYAMRQGLI